MGKRRENVKEKRHKPGRRGKIGGNRSLPRKRFKWCPTGGGPRRGRRGRERPPTNRLNRGRKGGANPAVADRVEERNSPRRNPAGRWFCGRGESSVGLGGGKEGGERRV